MPELLTNIVTADAYTAAATIGPALGAKQLIFQVSGAPVLVRYWKPVHGEPGMQPTQELFERYFAAGAIQVVTDNIAGAMFRSANKGQPATITAELVFESDPIGEFQSSGVALPSGVGQPLIPPSQTLISVSPTTLGPFDVSGWPYLLLGASVGGLGVGARLSALYAMANGANVVAGNLDVFSNGPFNSGNGTPGLLVVKNMAQLVTLQVNLFNIGAGACTVFASPCSFSRAPLNLGSTQAPLGLAGTILYQAGHTVNPGVTFTVLMPPYYGIAQSLFQGFSGGAGSGPFDITLDAADYTGTIQQRLLAAPAQPIGNFTAYTFEHPVVSMPMVVSLKNTGTTQGIAAFMTVIKEPQ